MKVTKKEIKALEGNAIDKKLVEVREELMKVAAQSASGAQPKDLNSIKNLKKTVARLLTQKNQKEAKKKP